MSHISNVQCEIRDLDALDEALVKFGAELVRDQQTFKAYFGRANNKCAHAIRLKDDHNAYEIGLQRKAQAGDAYELACDFWGGSLARFGEGLQRLTNEYTAVVAERTLQRDGWSVRRVEETPQRIRLAAYR
jgi:hypothetical protein